MSNAKEYRIEVQEPIMRGQFMYFDSENEAMRYADVWSNFWLVPRVVLVQELTNDEYLTVAVVEGENIF